MLMCLSLPELLCASTAKLLLNMASYGLAGISLVTTLALGGAPVWFQNARDQQIFFGETLAGLLGPTTMCSSGGTVFGSSTTQELYLRWSDVLLLAPKTMFINLSSFRQCWFTPSIPEYGMSGPVGSPCSPFAVS